MEKEILDLLCENARISIKEIAERLGCDEKQVASTIKSLEDSQVIRGYKTIVNEKYIDDTPVRALIEVKITPQRDCGFDSIAARICKFPEVRTAHLISGDYDIELEVEGKSLQEVSLFVSNKLASIDGVLSTATHFMLKRYKEYGTILEGETHYERLKVSP